MCGARVERCFEGLEEGQRRRRSREHRDVSPALQVLHLPSSRRTARASVAGCPALALQHAPVRHARRVNAYTYQAVQLSRGLGRRGAHPAPSEERALLLNFAPNTPSPSQMPPSELCCISVCTRDVFAALPPATRCDGWSQRLCPEQISAMMAKYSARAISLLVTDHRGRVSQCLG